MKIDNKTEQLILALTKQTVNNSISWKSYPIPSSLTKGTDNYYPFFLITEYKNKFIGLYQKRYRYFHDEHEFYWSEDAGLCILDQNDTVIWECNERSSTLSNLLDIARKQAAGINDILNDLLD